MKRKIISQKTAYTVTLPIDWIRENNLSNKEYINIKQEQNDIIISTDKKQKLETTTIDLKDIDKTYLRIMIENPYLKGYDLIILNYKDSKIIKDIEEITSNLIGIEIIDEKENYCKLAQTATPTKDEFETILRRIFNIIKHTNEIIIQDLHKRQINNIEKIDKYTKDVRKLLLFCTRTLHKMSLVSRKEESFLHLVLERLILIQHNQYYLYSKVYNKLGNKKLNLKEEVVNIYIKITELFDIFTKMFYNKDFNNFNIINKQWNEIYFKKGQELFINCNYEESVIIYHSMHLSKLIFLISQPGEVLIEFK